MKIDNQTISLHDLRFYAYHGVEPQERIVGAWYIINLDIQTDFSKSLESDSLSDTINYALAAKIIKTEMDTPSNLIEHVAGRIASKLQAEFPSILSMNIKIEKENPPVCSQCKSAAVSILFTK